MMPPKTEPLCFETPESISLPSTGLVDFSINVDNLHYDCRLNSKIAGDVLYVVFNGAVDRSKYQIPVFSRWNWHTLFNAPILAVFDPTLHLDSKLRIGWSIGTKFHDATSVMARIATATAQSLGIKDGRVVCYGSSSGGFAAITVAARMAHGRFIAYNPQTTLIRYYKDHLADMAKVFAPGETVENIATTYPLRWSAIEALRDAYANNRCVRGVIAQNSEDHFHHINHYLPFCEAFGLPDIGGTSPDLHLHSTTFKDTKGHGPESSDVARHILETYLPKLIIEPDH